jgi:hypothetical protein
MRIPTVFKCKTVEGQPYLINILKVLFSILDWKLFVIKLIRIISTEHATC